MDTGLDVPTCMVWGGPDVVQAKGSGGGGGSGRMHGRTVQNAERTEWGGGIGDGRMNDHPLETIYDNATDAAE